MVRRSGPRRTMGLAMAFIAVGTAGCSAGTPTATPATSPVSVSGSVPAPASSDGDGTVATSSAAAATEDQPVQRHPDVVGVRVTPGSEPGTWDVAATISSPYDTPQRYADAFRVLAGDGTQLGVRELLHDHANEQPFTRSLVGLAIPEDVDRITVEARDLANGWGGTTTSVDLPR